VKTASGKVASTGVSGRKKKTDIPITPRSVRALAEIHCTQEEACHVLGIGRHEFRNLLEKRADLRNQWERGPSFGNVSVRRQMYQLAMRGDVNALRHLSQHWLGEHDIVEVNFASMSGAEIRRFVEKAEEGLAELQARITGTADLDGEGDREATRH
jgi:hypothetical protein